MSSSGFEAKGKAEVSTRMRPGATRLVAAGRKCCAIASGAPVNRCALRCGVPRAAIRDMSPARFLASYLSLIVLPAGASGADPMPGP